MNYSHPQNPNLTLTTDDHYQGMRIYNDKGPVITQYLEQMNATMQRSLLDHPRTLVVRFDLYFPDNGVDNDQMSRDMGLLSPEEQPEVISRFVKSLKSQIRSDLARRMNAGKRVHPCRLRYVWAREYSSTERLHYHVAIMVNYDTYRMAGRFKDPRNGLALMATQAWHRVLNLEYFGNSRLVRFPDNPSYVLYANDPDLNLVYANCFYRLSYFAKSETKMYGQHLRSFGCSQK
ncbi:inovirus Gp2 family protein [Vibrio astriarenae]